VGDVSTKQILAVPALLCASMLLIGGTAAYITDIGVSGLFVPYLATAWAVTLLCLLVFIFLQFANLARGLVDQPIPIVAEAVKDRAPLLVLPAIIFPLFLVGFTSSKVAIPHLVGFEWDRFWADADRLIFGDDVWRITHHVFGSSNMLAWEWLYTTIWGFTLVFAKALAAIYLPRQRVAVFYTAMLGTWFFGGWLMAYCFSAAGPVFAHVFDPTLAQRFAPLREVLGNTLAPDSPIRLTQAYLASAVDSGIAVRGGGISAMPSMHLGAASIYVLAARGTRWVVPAITFWILIFIGSGHFGYHYWVDGIFAAGVAWFCWETADRYYSGRLIAGRGRAPTVEAEPTFVT